MIRAILEENDNVQPNDRTMEVLHREFPQCFNAEGKFDMAALQELLQDKVDLVKEGSGFKFLGKNYASLLSSMDTTTVLVPDTEHNDKPENKDSQNVYISGDNLDALKHLVKSYSGKVKCIYIDPPYNTGSDGFVYNDKFKFTAEELEEKLSISEEQAQRIFAMTTRGAASHAAWLTFMMPRLQYAKDLLSDDGVIFISIDENEQANLKLLCDYIFGEENQAGEIIWKNSSKNDEDYISMQHEYVLVYVKSKEFNTGEWIEPKQGTDEIFKAFDGFKAKHGNDWDAIHKEALAWYRQFPESNPIYDCKHYNRMDERGVYFASDISGPNPGQYTYDVIHPKTKKVCKMPASGWRFEEKEMLNRIQSDLIFFPEDETTIPNNKTYLKDTLNQSLTSIIYRDGRVASKHLTELMGTNCFSNPKDPEVIAKLLNAVGVKSGDIVVDFFSGSATTAESVMAMNDQDKDIKFILVQLEEDLDISLSRATGRAKTVVKNAIEICDNLNVPHTIDQIGMERIKRAAKKIKEQNPLFAGDLGFKHYTLAEPDENTIDQMLKFEPTDVFGSNLMEKFGKDTILSTYAMRDGYGLTPEFKEVKFGGYTAYLCGKHLYMLDTEFNVEEDLTDLVDTYNKDHSFPADNVVIFGYSFNFGQTDAIKKNLSAITDRNRINVDIRY